MKTLPDYLCPGLRLLSVGLNPSIPSVEAGYYFANPRNRFWKALQQSRLVEGCPEPGVQAIERLFHDDGIGFTDLVKRPTPGAKQLKAADYREGAPILLQKIDTFRPALVWFHGKLAWKQFVRYAMPDNSIDHDEWGKQVIRPAGVCCYVTPNPSPANAAWSLTDLVQWYDRLADELTGG